MTWRQGRSGTLCGQPAVLRRGVRCPGGCLGEGEFEYACAEHAEWIRHIRGGPCVRCKATVELFRPQDLAVGTGNPTQGGENG